MQTNKIGEIRNEFQITQHELAGILGWGQSRVSGYETGAREPRIKDARAIVNALKKLGAKTHFDEVFPE